MTALVAARTYAERGWRIFPCGSDKLPVIDDWPNRASRNPAKIECWWQRWPTALIGLPTGRVNGAVVLDVDVKRPEAYGLDTLDDLGFAILPVTPMAHTRSGGLHLYFTPPVQGLRNTTGSRGRGIGPGLDWRGDGGFVILPSPGSGYWWDPHCNFTTASLAPVPVELLPREPERASPVRPVRPAAGLSPYAEAALDNACRRIVAAPCGEQEQTLNSEAFAIGTLAGARAIPSDFARRALLWAAGQMTSFDPRRPWHPRELENKIDHAFGDGRSHPRGDRHG
jgi:putative DNA primase/helicase